MNAKHIVLKHSVTLQDN